MGQVNVADGVEIGNIYDITDFIIGHVEDKSGITGCTVVICEHDNPTAGSDLRGGSPATRGLDIFSPYSSGAGCNAIVLSGGSCYGLNAAGGVENYLESKEIGFNFANVHIPLVAQAVIFDLGIGDPKARPSIEMGFEAAKRAHQRKQYRDGNIGAGYGAIVGKYLPRDHWMKGGLGTYCLKKGDLYVAAIMVVNALGNVVNPKTGEQISGMLGDDGKILDTEQFILDHFSSGAKEQSLNTTIGVIITNAKLSNQQAHKIASWSHNGLARAIRPVHTVSDGDTMFTISCNEVEATLDLIGVMAVSAVENAIVSAVKNAHTLEGILGYPEYIAKRGITDEN